MIQSSVLTLEKQVENVVNLYFQKERHGDLKARNHVKKEFLKYLIKTDDGSYTLSSGEINGNFENMHNSHGAITESLEKFVKPSNLNNKK